MRCLTDGVMNTGQASPIAMFDQQAVQFGESRPPTLVVDPR